jgi:hypothetical protein
MTEEHANHAGLKQDESQARVPYRHPQPAESFPSWSFQTLSRRTNAFGFHSIKMFGFGPSVYPPAGVTG